MIICFIKFDIYGFVDLNHMHLCMHQALKYNFCHHKIIMVFLLIEITFIIRNFELNEAITDSRRINYESVFVILTLNMYLY